MIKMNVLKDASEVVPYDNPNIPIYVKKGRLSDYTRMQMLCHWHDDVEFIRIVKGHMHYYVNGIRLRIEEGDGLFINTRQLHYGFSGDGEDCEYICILFHPQLLFSNLEIWRLYLEPVVGCEYIPQRYLSAADVKSREILSLMEDICAVEGRHEEGFHLQLMGIFYTLWLRLFDLYRPVIEREAGKVDKDIEIQKKMVEFIHYHFSTRITLNDIARAGNVCRSKCCQIFKKHLDQSPIGFLNAYRLEISMALLKEGSMNITEIALACGFSNPSYFSEIFLKYKGCTPTQFREL